jgi:hypothetical protein
MPILDVSNVAVLIINMKIIVNIVHRREFFEHSVSGTGPVSFIRYKRGEDSVQLIQLKGISFLKGITE